MSMCSIHFVSFVYMAAVLYNPIHCCELVCVCEKFCRLACNWLVDCWNITIPLAFHLETRKLRLLQMLVILFH